MKSLSHSFSRNPSTCTKLNSTLETLPFGKHWSIDDLHGLLYMYMYIFDVPIRSSLTNYQLRFGKQEVFLQHGVVFASFQLPYCPGSFVHANIPLHSVKSPASTTQVVTVELLLKKTLIIVYPLCSTSSSFMFCPFVWVIKQIKQLYE